MKKWYEFLNKDDLSRFMKSENLLNSWYVLSNENVTVLVDATKPRVLKIFTHGIFGTLQDIIYDVYPMERSLGMWGLVPRYIKNNKVFMPFKHGPGNFNIPEKDKVSFDPKKNKIAFTNLPTWDEKGVEGEPIDFSVNLNSQEIQIEVSAPEDVEEVRVWGSFYPLYNSFKTEESEELLDIEYYTTGVRATYHPYYNETIGPRLMLIDSYGRLPTLKLKTRGKIRLESMCDPKFGNTFRLHTESINFSNKEVLNLSLIPNPVVVYLRPIIGAEVKEVVRIKAPSIPYVEIDGAKMNVKSLDKGEYSIDAFVESGRHELKVITDEACSLRVFYAANDPKSKLIAMGEAISKIGWDKPRIKNLLPYIVKLDKFAGPRACSRDGMAYVAHSLRVIPALVTATLTSGKRKYVDRAYEYLEAGKIRAHKTDKGALFLPLILDMEGKVPERYRFASRPSDVGLQVRGWLYTGRVYKVIGDKVMRDKCFRYALDFAKLLVEMQRPDGSFATRYSYPDLTPNESAEGGLGTVNPWIIHIWEAAEVGKEINPDTAKKLRKMCERHIDWLWDTQKENLRTNIGGEMVEHLLASTGPATLFLLIKYLATKEKIWLERARESMKMVGLMSTHYIDQPQNFFYTCLGSLGEWFNQPNLFHQGSMHDLETVDAAQAMSRYTKDEFAEKLLRCIFFDRLAGTVQDNGCIINLDIRVPNYTYVKRDMSEPLNYGAVGIVGYHYVKNFQHVGRV